jgi:outer membrane protein
LYLLLAMKTIENKVVMKQAVLTVANFIVVIFLTSGIGQAFGSSKFTLSEAQAFALENSYFVKNTTLEITKARKKVWETIASGLPQANGTSAYNKFLNLPVSLIPGEFFGGEAGTYIPVKFGQDYSSDFGFTVSQMIFDGSYIVGVGSSQIYLDMARQSNEKTAIDIRNAVAQAYYLVLIGEENLKVMGENLENTRKMLLETTAYYENGFMEEQDVDQMKMLVKTAENEVLKAEREITIATTVLKYAMGMPFETDMELTDQLSSFVTPLITAEVKNGFDVSAHIDYRLAATQFTAAEKLLKLEKVAFLPRLSGFYSYTKTAYGNKANLFSSDQSWYPSSLVGLSLTVPLFTSGQRVFKIHQAQIELEQAANIREQASQTIQKDYLTAIANLETAVEKYGNDVESRELAEKILSKGKIKFNNGISSSTELMQLENQYLQSHGAYIASVMQLLMSDLELKKALGKL